MKPIITLKDSDARYLHYLLGKKHKSKAGLVRLVKLELLTMLAQDVPLEDESETVIYWQHDESLRVIKAGITSPGKHWLEISQEEYEQFATLF